MRSLILFSVLTLGLASTTTAADSHGVRMFVRHDVADYAAWRKGYDSVAAMQRSGGVTAQAVYQSTNNPNNVTVTHDFKSLEKAKAFAASVDLKAAMQKAGVKGAPHIWFAMPTAGSSGTPGHVRMFVRHEVADYAAWRKVYDGGGAKMRRGGVTSQAVLQSADNPNDVTVTHDFKTVEKAKEFAASAELKATMKSAGVKGTPQIWFTTRASK